MGASALSALARSGARVLGLDQFAPPHDRGSSHGETRLLRVAYAEGSAYVPMAQRSIELWRAVQRHTGESLFVQSGVSYFGSANTEWLSGLQELGAPLRHCARRGEGADVRCSEGLAQDS